MDRKPLTHTRQAESARPEAKPYKLNAGDRLYLEVMPNGTKRWRYRYRFSNREKMLSMGIFPAVSLLDAKTARDNANRLLAQGIDPSESRQAEKLASLHAQRNTFEAVAQMWLHRLTDKAEATRVKAEWLLKYPVGSFGARPIKDITPRMVLSVCLELESQGKLETAHRIKTVCSQVFRFAIGLGLVESDPTRDLRGLIKAPAVKHRASITDPRKVGKLLLDIDAYSGSFETICALKLAPLVFIRPGELRSALWADIDLEQGIWSYTPPKTRRQTQVELIVPLASQAISILRSLQKHTGNSPYVFRGSGKYGYISENTVNNALRRMGYSSDEMCGHGFRAMARTILDEVLSFRPELIEQQLAHVVRDPNGRAYNRTRHLDARKEMMQSWADYLDQLRTNAAETG